ncbi:MAG TPA: HAD family phosphatase [Bacteroidales bacterium]|nr:HAD family phosphatase [Bacteroidales bacterium]HPT08777.1 HAD family phosphatase [Bacteroidales bacterium]
MNILIPGPVPAAPIKNIVFDFGGVICDLNMQRTYDRFKEMGMHHFNTAYSVSEQEDIFRSYERGNISSAEFRDILKKLFDQPVTDTQIDEAWNAMLLDIPLPRVRLLEKLRPQYRTFILSNSNEIHYHHYLQNFTIQTGYNNFEELVEKTYFSFKIHLQKPGKEIFDFVLHDSGIDSEETLFIDDSTPNTETAKKMGFQVWRLKPEQGEDITDLFTE